MEKDVFDSILFNKADLTTRGESSSFISISGKSSEEIVAKSAWKLLELTVSCR